MTNESKQLLDAAIRTSGLKGSFCPVELGTQIGLTKAQAETAARALSDAGVFVLGFDMAAHFSSEYRALKSGDEKPKKAKKEAGVEKKKPRKVSKAAKR